MSVPFGRVRSVGTRQCRMLASRCPRQVSRVRSTQQRAARSGEHGQDVGGELGGGVELSDGSEERGDVIEALDLLLGSLDGVVVDETQLFGLHPARPDRDVDPSRATTRRLRVDQATVMRHGMLDLRPDPRESLAGDVVRYTEHVSCLVSRECEHVAEHEHETCVTIEALEHGEGAADWLGCRAALVRPRSGSNSYSGDNDIGSGLTANPIQ